MSTRNAGVLLPIGAEAKNAWSTGQYCDFIPILLEKSLGNVIALLQRDFPEAKTCLPMLGHSSSGNSRKQGGTFFMRMPVGSIAATAPVSKHKRRRIGLQVGLMLSW
jgi:hypothetical protein